MLRERELRRSGFRAGLGVRLADGQIWMLPVADASSEADSSSDVSDPDLQELVLAMIESEDNNERLRAELALAVHLLSKNYALEPHAFQEILRLEPQSPAMFEAQRVFRQAGAVLIQELRHKLMDTRDSTPRKSWIPLISWFRGRRWTGQLNPLGWMVSGEQHS